MLPKLMWIKLYTQQGPTLSLREARSASLVLSTYISLKNNSPFSASLPVTESWKVCYVVTNTGSEAFSNSADFISWIQMQIYLKHALGAYWFGLNL